jgi:hypothetical protein
LLTTIIKRLAGRCIAHRDGWLRAENCGWTVSGEKIGWLLAKSSYHKTVAAGGGDRLKNQGLETGWSNDQHKKRDEK